MGRAMLKFMNLCHAPLTNWGLKLVDIQDGWTMLDIGCGGGATLQRLLKRSQDAKVYGILEDAGFIQTEIHRMKPSNVTIIGIKELYFFFAAEFFQKKCPFRPSNGIFFVTLSPNGHKEFIHFAIDETIQQIYRQKAVRPRRDRLPG
jgi:SAM-dependent methyltransferase